MSVVPKDTIGVDHCIKKVLDRKCDFKRMHCKILVKDQPNEIALGKN